MSSLQGFVRVAWSGEGGFSGAVYRTATLPLEWLFRLAVGRRNRAFHRDPGRSTEPGIPVVSVGNLSVGGTGKTPVASWLVKRLQHQGFRPALVARGYGEDELALHRGWTPGVPVIANPDRVAGVREAQEEGADVAVLDDGFQHRRLRRTLDVVLVGAEEGLPGALLPRGPFREPITSLNRAQVVIVTRKSATESRQRSLAEEVRRATPRAVVAGVSLRPGSFRALGGAEVALKGSVLVATAVARPASVRAAVEEQAGVSVLELRAFPDHHVFSEVEVQGLVARASGRPIVVTEKDAVKLKGMPAAGRGSFVVLEQTLEWDFGRDAVESLLESTLERQ